MVFRAPTSGSVVTPAEFAQSAFQQPLGVWDTIGTGFVSGAVESYGLGTGLRAAQIPGGRQNKLEQVGTGTAVTIPPNWTVSPYIKDQFTQRLENDEELAERGEEGMTQEQWKNSEFFRDNIPYDKGMTLNRARALSEWEDARRVREFYISKRPIAGLAGSFLGAATDPINYIPIAGPGTRLAAATRFGRVGGAVATSSADAAMNTALFGIATQDQRAEFGDDVSFEALVTDIALGAAIGGTFGAGAQLFGSSIKYLKNRNIYSELADAKKVIQAKQSLNEAVGTFVENGEIELSARTLQTSGEVTGAYDDLLRARADRAPVRQSVDGLIEEAAPGRLKEQAELSNLVEVNKAGINDLRAQMNEPDIVAARRDAKALENLEARFDRLNKQIDGTKPGARRDNLIIQRDALGREGAELAARLDEATLDRADELDLEVRKRGKTLETFEARRAEVDKELGTLREAATKRYWSDTVARARTEGMQVYDTPYGEGLSRFDPNAEAGAPPNKPTGTLGDIEAKLTPVNPVAAKLTGLAEGPPKPLEASRFKPKTMTLYKPPRVGVAERLQRIEATLQQGETPEGMEEAFGVDSKTGEYSEEIDIDTLRKEDRLDAEDLKALEASDTLFKQADAYAKAMETASNCVLRS